MIDLWNAGRPHTQWSQYVRERDSHDSVQRHRDLCCPFCTRYQPLDKGATQEVVMRIRRSMEIKSYRTRRMLLIDHS